MGRFLDGEELGIFGSKGSAMALLILLGFG
jgi:hypothetical protein